MAKSWNNIPEDRYHDAVKALTAAASGDIAACAIGLGADIYPYFTNKKILTPNNIGEFKTIIRKYAVVKCAYYERHADRESVLEIVDFLVKHAISTERYGSIVVYTLSD